MKVTYLGLARILRALAPIGTLMTLTPRAQNPVFGLVRFDQALDPLAGGRVRNLPVLVMLEVFHAGAAGLVMAGVSIPVSLAEGTEVVLAADVIVLFSGRDLVIVGEVAFELEGELHGYRRQCFVVVGSMLCQDLPNQAEKVVKEDLGFVVE